MNTLRPFIEESAPKFLNGRPHEEVYKPLWELLNELGKHTQTGGTHYCELHGVEIRRAFVRVKLEGHAGPGSRRLFHFDFPSYLLDVPDWEFKAKKYGAWRTHTRNRHIARVSAHMIGQGYTQEEAQLQAEISWVEDFRQPRHVPLSWLKEQGIEK